jgi:hypothetical protein
MSDNKCVVQIRIYRNTLINRYSAELVFPQYPQGRRIQRSCGGKDAAELRHWLANVVGGLEVHLEESEKGGDITGTKD